MIIIIMPLCLIQYKLMTKLESVKKRRRAVVLTRFTGFSSILNEIETTENHFILSA